MAWSGLGVTIFLVALAVGERSFRLSGLVLLLSVWRSCWRWMCGDCLRCSGTCCSSELG